MDDFNHAEAYCMMEYASENGRQIVTIWNTRDGVTPFGVQINGVTMLHRNVSKDRLVSRMYMPDPGDWIFVSFTPENFKELMTERVDENLEYALEIFGSTREDAIEKVFEKEWQEGMPRLIQVTQDWFDNFCPRGVH
jgi:hypothetical protein